MFSKKLTNWLFIVGEDGKCEDRLPRTGSGIPGLSEDSRSVLSRATSSILSAASPESAVRLARPPSVCSSLQLPAVASKGSRGSGSGGRWRYEKRGAMQRSKPPLSPLCSAASSEIGSCDSALSASLPDERSMVSNAVVVRFNLVS